MTKLRPEIRPLLRDDIQSEEQLWRALSGHPDDGLNLVVKGPAPADVLVPDLAIEALREDPSRIERLRPHWLLGLLLLLGVLLAVWFIRLPRERVVIAAVALKQNSTLAPADVDLATLLSMPHTFTDAAPLAGAILARDIAANTPLHYEDVLRPQVVAARDVPSGTLVSRDMISVTWSAYQPNGITDIAAVVGRPLGRPVQAGKLIPGDALASPQLQPQVSVSVPAGLPANHVIQAGEVALGDAIPSAKAFSKLSDVVGSYLLVAVPAGEAVRADQVVRAPLLAGKKIATVGPIQLNTLSPQLSPGEPVSVWLYPRDAPGAKPVGVDAILLALGRRDQDIMLTVAADEADLLKVMPLLGKADVFVVQRTP